MASSRHSSWRPTHHLRFVCVELGQRFGMEACLVSGVAQAWRDPTEGFGEYGEYVHVDRLEAGSRRSSSEESLDCRWEKSVSRAWRRAQVQPVWATFSCRKLLKICHTHIQAHSHYTLTYTCTCSVEERGANKSVSPITPTTSTPKNSETTSASTLDRLLVWAAFKSLRQSVLARSVCETHPKRATRTRTYTIVHKHTHTHTQVRSRTHTHRERQATSRAFCCSKLFQLIVVVGDHRWETSMYVLEVCSAPTL